MPDVLNLAVRKQVLSEIEDNQNNDRKAEHLKRFEVYRDRQHKYVLDKLYNEFSKQTVASMRKVTSINLCKRIVDELGSIYNEAPTRVFPGASDEETAVLMAHYKSSSANVKLKKANRYFKLFDQCALQVIPMEGKLHLRVLYPGQYDVIPSETNPELPYCYIVNTMNKDTYLGIGDGTNQAIADSDDYKSMQRFVWWTAEYNFVTDGNGQIVDGADNLVNPIGKLPFIDIAGDKDFEFWVRTGKNITEFALDFSVVLSDIAEINKLQGYAQAVIVSEKVPDNIVVGPNRVLHLPVDSTTSVTPSFAFESPNPNLEASLKMLDQMSALFLTSEGLDPKTVSGNSDANRFSSAAERLLSMIDKFEATKEDFDLFRWVEQELFQLIKLWHNLLAPTDYFLNNSEISRVMISPDQKMEVKFYEPTLIETRSEIESSVEKRLSLGLITKAEAIMELRKVDKESAEEIIEKLEEEKVSVARNILTAMESEDDDNGEESEPENQP